MKIKSADLKKYAGNHVLVVDNKVFPLGEGKKANEDIASLERKYGKTPIITFVPRQDITYILVTCKK